MNKKKKIIVISSILGIVLLALIIGLVWYFTTQPKKEEEQSSRVTYLYDTLVAKNAYSFETILDDEHKSYYAKLDDKAYTDTIYDGNESIYVIRDGNSYLLMQDTKTYYTYLNNEIDLKKVEVALQDLKDVQYQEGKEEIDHKKYTYEEYDGITQFLMGDIDDSLDTQEAKTRFYFDGKELVYIKTIIGEYQEVLKVNISYEVDSDLFEIPSDYQKG